MGQQLGSIATQIWTWVGYESGAHPFVFLGIAVVIVSAWILYKSEVRTK
jgi:hypothetical protein